MSSISQIGRVVWESSDSTWCWKAFRVSRAFGRELKEFSRARLQKDDDTKNEIAFCERYSQSSAFVQKESILSGAHLLPTYKFSRNSSKEVLTIRLGPELVTIFRRNVDFPEAGIPMIRITDI